MTDQVLAKDRRTIAVSKERAQYDHEVLDIARVVRVVKGGRRFRFRASVLVGNRNGKVGFGVGKSRDVQSAIQKAQAQAEKSLITIVLDGATIAHEVFARYKGAQLKLRPAQPGTGVIAGNVVRAVAELAGVKDLVSKAFGSSNKINNVKAALLAFQNVSKKK
ncbi:MAG: 30S ribosomal protein S5 [Candidatus Andersenbacteria bacterium]|nr:30S ribosomal protein S5 [Candidatus Andersenbacteria bacterium]MBI3251057.1 30S ribosomal protein S5 [Candidatus Andersenbacteria bacterium]